MSLESHEFDDSSIPSYAVLYFRKKMGYELRGRGRNSHWDIFPRMCSPIFIFETIHKCFLPVTSMLPKGLLEVSEISEMKINILKGNFDVLKIERIRKDPLPGYILGLRVPGTPGIMR